jgi:hypothetical protein
MRSMQEVKLSFRPGGVVDSAVTSDDPNHWLLYTSSLFVRVVMSLHKRLTGCMHPEAAARFPAAGSAEHTGGSPGTLARDSTRSGSDQE